MKPTVNSDTSVSHFQKIQIDLTGPYSVSDCHNRLSMIYSSDYIIKWGGETRNVKNCYIMAAIDILKKLHLPTQ